MRRSSHLRCLAAVAMATALTAGATATAAQAAAGPPPGQGGHDFAYAGVIIWAEPRAGSTQTGRGYPGQGWRTDRVEQHAEYQCETHSTDWWHYGRNLATGVVGWVPGCNLIQL
ncbi:hypothetical protein [Actinomadura sp. 21ATH]|uniref:hypothetical protein n=1 Tax=Actinomadura sp. 21ATH TaxID=1735444 RepID=UPI0035BEF9EC